VVEVNIIIITIIIIIIIIMIIIIIIITIIIQNITFTEESGWLTRYSDGLDGPGSISGRFNNFLFSTASRPTLGPTQPPIQWVPGGGGAFPPGIKQQGREADPSPPSNAEVMNGGAIHPPHHTSSWHSA
jgi:hypothetical protein